MSIRRARIARRGVAVCLLALASFAPPAGARDPAPGAADKPIVEARLLASEPAGEGSWLIQVEEVLNGSVPGSVLVVSGLPEALVAAGEEGARLRLVLAPEEDGTYRVLSGHRSPEADPALFDPEPLPLAKTPTPDPGRPGAALAPKAVPTASYEQQVVELVNQERWNIGQLPPLKEVDALHASSETHSSNMAARDFFAHCDPDTKTGSASRMSAAGYAAASASENIAAGYLDAAAVMAGWMASSGHRANILSTARYEIGIGYVYQSGDQPNVRYDLDRDCVGDPNPTNGPFYRYWTQNFGRRNNVYPVVIEREALSTSSTTVDLYVYGAGWAQEMRFSNDGSTWSAWETYDPNKTWTLAGGAGTKTVYAQLRNGFTLQASDTIYLDAPCTASPNLAVPDQTVSSTVTFEACDTVSAVAGFTVGAAGDVTFQAGRRVVLGPGFAVLAGGTFQAVIATPP